MESAVAAGLCSLCQSSIAEGEAVTACPACRTAYHADCWAEIGGCGLYGCTQVPATDKRADLEIPASHWGRETKACPVCTSDIQAMAIRCRVCGTNFGKADPQSGAAWRDAQRDAGGRPRLAKQVIAFAVAAALPPLAPLVCIGGALFWWQRRQRIAKLNRVVQALLPIAIAIAAVELLVFVAVLAVTSFRH